MESSVAYFTLYEEIIYQNYAQVFYCVKKFDPNPALQILVYTFFSQDARLTTLSNELSIKLPTQWYIATLVTRGGIKTFLMDVIA